MNFTFNNITSDSKNLICQGFVNPNPDIIRSYKAVGNRQYAGRSYFTPREITVNVFYASSSTADLYAKVTELTSWLSTKDAKKLILSDNSTVYYNAVATLEVDEQIQNRLMRATITFTCLDNCIYSTADNSVLWNPSDYL